MVTSMLEKAIEIEGLLRIIRDGNPLPETYILLNIKTAELAEQALCLEERAAVLETEETTIASGTEAVTEAKPEQMASQESLDEATTDAKPEQMAAKESFAEATTDISTSTESEENAEEPEENESREAAGQQTETEIQATEETSSAEGDFVLASATVSTPVLSPVIFAEDDPAHLHKPANSKQPEAVSMIQPDTVQSYPDLEDEDLDFQDDDILLDFEETPTFTTDGYETPTEELKPINIVTPESEMPIPDIKDSGKTEAIPDTETMSETKSETETTADTDSNRKSKRQVKLKSAFSLNDRFLYSRELFEGNMKMFDSTLEFIEGIEDYSIIEDYFYSELEWNPEDRNVAAFMEILRPHFREL